MGCYLLCFEDANVAVDGGGLEQAVYQVLLHSKAGLIDKTVTQLPELLFVGEIGRRPFGKAVPPTDRNFLY
jgi:hypothetical protein